VTAAARCPLCDEAGDTGTQPVWRDDHLRVVRVIDTPDHPAFYRVIWHAHVAEFTDLLPANRSHLMRTVAAVETVLREALQPDKINLASLGNMVPHLHWHVIARFAWDSHFPQPIWGVSQRQVPAQLLQRMAQTLPVLDLQIAAALNSSD
jgi:diadenosine tetraphosphate (Ap4A) HIT family hydrolase